MSPLNAGPAQPAEGLTDWLARRHIDAWLAAVVLLICGYGLLVLYSAGGQDIGAVVSQAQRLALGLAIMLICAQAPPELYRTFAPWLFLGTLLLLVLVLVLGDASKGARRWLDLGVVRFQPSELMKLAMPITMATFLHWRGLPLRLPSLGIAILMIAIPAWMIARQPDLGTSLLVVTAGVLALYFAGLSWRWIGTGVASAAAAAPLVWFYMHDYQRTRVLTFLNPESDPLGAGYHIAQSKIAIGSGGLFGKGWLNGTQTSLDFLPESHTDFVFAVIAEELGLLGVMVLITLYALVVWRGMLISLRGQDTFQRLLGASLTLTFFFYAFINIGMVVGLLPVVGVPLPLVSYGGTSMVSLLAGFGILMSLQTHRKLISN